MPASAAPEPARRAALESAVAARQRLAASVLPPELDRRILDLGERKETLSPDERAELLAWVAFLLGDSPPRPLARGNGEQKRTCNALRTEILRQSKQ
jgi:hypothetical protein